MAVGTPICHKPPQHPTPTISSSLSALYSPKLSVCLLATCVFLFVIFHIKILHNAPSHISWPFTHNLQLHTSINTPSSNDGACTEAVESMADKLRDSVTFLPLKDLRFAHAAHQGHTWFMSSMYDSHEEGEVQYQQFPSNASKGRILCIKGHDTHDGVWNYYALAYPKYLPNNATLVKGLTFISYNHYNYDNIWHGLSAVFPFISWHEKNSCAKPDRWILYHWGEVRTKMSQWLRTLMEATFGGPLNIEGLNEFGDDEAVCFEEAVVMRHNEGGMSRVKRMEAYDLLRCRARKYCKVIASREGKIGLTLFMRTGARSFKNESAVVGIFDRECKKVKGCQLVVAHSNNLTFCDQVKLISSTDILVSPHGAQLTNMFFMDRNSSVMEFFPKGWLKLAGVGQYVYHWLASWSGMKHEGAWRDPYGNHCPYPDDDRRCMSIYKSGLIGHNGTYFAEWARKVLSEVKLKKIEGASEERMASGCACS